MRIAKELESLKVPIGRLKLDPRNARVHERDSINAIKASLSEHGQLKPIVTLKSGQVVAGNGTLLAARELGFTHLAVVTFTDEKKAARYALQDNRTAELSTWDDQLLAELLTTARSEDPAADLTSLGFTDAELTKLMDGVAPDAPEDEVPEPPRKPITRPGQVWILGNHRLVCGDALQPATVKKVTGGGYSRMAFTDPPYNVDYGSNKKHPSHKSRKILNDKQAPSAWAAFNRDLAGVLKAAVSGDIYVWGASGPEGMRQRLCLVESGFHWSATIIWKKHSLVLSPANFQRIYEPCFYGWTGKSSFNGDRTKVELWETTPARSQGSKDAPALKSAAGQEQAPGMAPFYGWTGQSQLVTGRVDMEVWEIRRPRASDLHPTMKPVELCRHGIECSSRRGDTVLDLFGGSGSTLIASEQSERACRMAELDPAYCDVIVERWQQFTGRKAKLEA